jgi:hypothetical protein
MNEEINYKDTGEKAFDELFRDNLKDFRIEPPPHVWQGISRKMLWKEILSFNFSNVTLKIWTIIASVVIIPAAVVLWSIQDSPVKGVNSGMPNFDKPQTAMLTGSSTSQVSPAVAPSINATHVNPGVSEHITDRKPSSADNSVIQSVSLKNPSVGPAKTNSGVTAPEVSPAKLVSPGPAITLNNTSETDISRSGREQFMINELTPIGFPQIMNTLAKVPGDSIITVATSKGPVKFNRPGTGWPTMVSLSLGVLPEKAWYKDVENYSYMNYWVHGGVTLHVARSSVETAIEMGYMLDQGKYVVDYKSRDSVGYFNNVVSFSTGANNEITYNTTTSTVYDSLHHSNDSRTSNRYTYLRIPVLFGYRLFQSDHFSVTLKAGPSVTFMIGSRESDPVIEYANARIIRVDETTPDRLKTNWQIWANLNLEMRLNQRFSLYLEPSWKYFMKPTAEQENPDARPPWSAGIGVGVQINLDNK